MVVDILGRNIELDDYVIYYNSIYRVSWLPKDTSKKHPQLIQIVLVNRSKTTRPAMKQSNYCVVVPKEDVEKLMRGEIC